MRLALHRPFPILSERNYLMAYGTRGKGAGRIQNMAKLGGPRRKLALKTDVREENLVHSNFKKAHKSGPHKKV